MRRVCGASARGGRGRVGAPAQAVAGARGARRPPSPPRPAPTPHHDGRHASHDLARSPQVQRLALEEARRQAIECFADNLSPLLLAPPLRATAVLGVDPGFAQAPSPRVSPCDLGAISSCDVTVGPRRVRRDTSSPSSPPAPPRCSPTRPSTRRCLPRAAAAVVVVAAVAAAVVAVAVAAAASRRSGARRRAWSLRCAPSTAWARWRWAMGRTAAARSSSSRRPSARSRAAAAAVAAAVVAVAATAAVAPPPPPPRAACDTRWCARTAPPSTRPPS